MCLLCSHELDRHRWLVGRLNPDPMSSPAAKGLKLLITAEILKLEARYRDLVARFEPYVGSIPEMDCLFADSAGTMHDAVQTEGDDGDCEVPAQEEELFMIPEESDSESE